MNLLISKRKSKLELYYSILKDCSDNYNTRIYLNYNLRISFSQLNECITDLLKQGLLEVNTFDKMFRTTARGKEFVRNYHELLSYIT